MMVASMRSAAATPKPICWNMINSPAGEAGEDGNDDQAAPVMIRAVEATPKVTASVVSRVAS